MTVQAKPQRTLADVRVRRLRHQLVQVLARNVLDKTASPDRVANLLGELLSDVLDRSVDLPSHDARGAAAHWITSK